MSVAPTQTTEASAINLMLASIGERPLDNVNDSSRLDVVRARAALNETNVLVQSRGWWFNEAEKVPLTPNNAGEYDLPPNVVKVDAYYEYIDKFVQRGKRLYNKVDRTYIGNTDILYVSWVELLPFNDLPESARLYIARRAGVVYQTRAVGSPVLFEFTEQAAEEAWGLLQNEETEHVDTNLTFAPGIRDAVYRR